MKKRVHIYYSGMVQGVGFRYITRETASELAVSGWVKNLHDGRVEVEGEADEEVLNHFLDKIGKHFSRYIKKVDVQWLEPTEETRDFKVMFNAW